MSPAALLAEVRAFGVTLSVISGGRLAARPKGKLSTDLREKISANKAEIVAHLLSVAPPELPEPPKRGPYVADTRRCAGCGRVGFVFMLVTGCGDHLCRRCWTSTTTIPPGHQPATPDLDRLMARADAKAERERA